MIHKTLRPYLGTLLVPVALLASPPRQPVTEALEEAVRVAEVRRSEVLEELQAHWELARRARSLDPGVPRDAWGSDGAPEFPPRVYTSNDLGQPKERRLEDVLRHLPGDLARATNRRIYQEYDRGFRDWQAGLTPAPEHLATGFEAQRWARFLFERWDRAESRDGVSAVRGKQILSRLYLPQPRSEERAGGSAYRQEAQRFASLRAATEAALEAAEAYEPWLEGKSLAWLPFRGGSTWENPDEWVAHVDAVEEALRAHRRSVGAALEARNVAVADPLAGAFEYRASPGPRLVPAGQGPAAEAASPEAVSWAAAFDADVLGALPPRLELLIQAKIVSAYFDGAADAKFDRGRGRAAPPEDLADYPADAEYAATLAARDADGTSGAPSGPRHPLAWEGEAPPPPPAEPQGFTAGEAVTPGEAAPSYGGLFGIDPGR